MTIKEKIAYREAMREMAEDSQTMFNHYMDEVKRMNEEIAEYYVDHVRGNNG